MEMKKLFSAGADSALIGTAFIKRDTNILTADERIYGFLGQNFSVNLIDFIHTDDKAAFASFIDDCDENVGFLSARCKRFDGRYAQIVFVVCAVTFDTFTYVKTDMLDVEYMSYNYGKCALEYKGLKTYSALNTDIVFLYDIKNDKLRLKCGRDEIFVGSVDQWRDDALANGRIANGFEDKYCGICDAIKQADGSGSHMIEAALFEDGVLSPTAISYGAVEYNSSVFYMTGTISRTDFTDRTMLDPLTGIYNKLEIGSISRAVLADAVKRNKIAVFIVIDLDHFKDVNDTYGHMVGDKALINTARIIKSVIGSRGYVGRIGGDEFFAVLRDFDGDHDALRAVLRSLREHIRRYFLHWGHGVKVTCSIGASSYPKDSSEYDVLFKLADYCMYLAKTKGRNRFVIFKSGAHGRPKDIIENGMMFSGYITEDEKIKHLMDVIKRCNEVRPEERTGLLKCILGEIKQIYGISAVQYCPSDKNGECFYIAEQDIRDPRAFMDIYDTFKYKIEEKGYIALGNYMNAKSNLPELASCMEENALCSLFIVPSYNDKKALKGLFALTSKEQYSWSDFDINTLLALCGTLEILT